jgi:hypothetical protein
MNTFSPNLAQETLHTAFAGWFATQSRAMIIAPGDDSRDDENTASLRRLYCSCGLASKRGPIRGQLLKPLAQALDHLPSLMDIGVRQRTDFVHENAQDRCWRNAVTPRLRCTA